MGYKCSYVAISAGIPRSDIWALPEGGRDRATTVVSQFFGEGYAYARSGTSDEAYPTDDGVWAGTWGDTVLFSADPMVLEGMAWSLPPGFGRWDLNIHSAVDLCQFAVTGGPYGDRSVELFADMDTSFEEACSGRPLPFEVPYLSGEHHEAFEDLAEEGDPYPVPFHPLDLGNAAVLWMFGIMGETPPDDAVVTPLLQGRDPFWEVPLHRFEPSREPEKKRKGWFGFGR